MDQKVKRVIIGFNWVLVQSETGCGLASTPTHTDSSCINTPNAGKLTKLNLISASEYVYSNNPLEVSIGMASINAFYNRYDFAAKNENGLDIFSKIDGPITIVGRFPGISKRFKNIRVVEKKPRKGEYSEKEAANLIPESAGVIITSSALLNGTAGNLIELAKKTRICLIGPSTPFAPKLLDLGIDCLAGTIVKDVKKMVIAVSEGGNVETFKPYGSFKVLSR
jgi:hypothetical protein